MRSSTLFFIASAFTATLALPRAAHAADKDASAQSQQGDDDDDDAKKKAPAKKADGVEPPAEEWNIYDVEEKPGKTYFFIGANYRGNVVPAFMLHLFVDEGKTVYTNMAGIEFEYRKDGFSLIPGLSYHELGTGDILFKQKNTSDIAGNYGLVNSGMKIMYAKLDILWSTKVHKNIEFEYGLGVGLGAVFGDLENSWVREQANGELANDQGRRFTRCDAVDVKGTGCNAADHQNSDVNKVNGYKEKNWFDGGSKPVLFPWLSVPQVGLRFKPIKNFVARLGIGFALTGFWFGFSAQYGLEQKPKP
jgi:hypothetical protein